MDGQLTERHLPITAIGITLRSMIERIPPLWIGIGISVSFIVIVLGTDSTLEDTWSALQPFYGV
jgi:hypothetical protein